MVVQMLRKCAFILRIFSVEFEGIRSDSKAIACKLIY